MTTSQRTEQFLARLHEVAEQMPHEDLASLLDVEITLLRNWLYRDKPSRFAVSLLKPRLDNKWRSLRRTTTK